MDSKLIKCPDCSGVVSKSAHSCPHCGAQVSSRVSPLRKGLRIATGGLSALGLVLAAGGAAGENSGLIAAGLSLAAIFGFCFLTLSVARIV